MATPMSDKIMSVYGEVRSYDLHYSTVRATITTGLLAVGAAISSFLFKDYGFIAFSALAIFLLIAWPISAYFQSLTNACHSLQKKLEKQLCFTLKKELTTASNTTAAVTEVVCTDDPTGQNPLKFIWHEKEIPLFFRHGLKPAIRESLNGQAPSMLKKVRYMCFGDMPQVFLTLFTIFITAAVLWQIHSFGWRKLVNVITAGHPEYVSPVISIDQAIRNAIVAESLEKLSEVRAHTLYHVEIGDFSGTSRTVCVDSRDGKVLAEKCPNK